MNKKYIVAVLIAMLILSINQSFIQYFLYKKKYDARTINLAGRQRMLSQKLNLEFYKVARDHHPSDQISDLFSKWKNGHYQLLSTPVGSDLSPIRDPQVLDLMERMSARIGFAEEKLAQLLSHQEIALEEINVNQAAFLAEMEEVVKLLEESSSEKHRFIVRIEIFLWFLSILAIVLEAVFIFRPIHQRLVNSLDELTRSRNILEKNLAELKSKNHELEQFVSLASHDLQEPLRTIISFTQLLQRKYKKQVGSLGHEEIAFIIAATKRMKALIGDLLNYAEIGRATEVKTIDCNQLVRTVEEDLQRILGEKNALLTIEPLPTIEVYETEMRQLFQNLILNGLKFQAEGVQPRIRISAKETNEGYQFSVEDNGIGIAPEFQEQIFLIFKRLHTSDIYEGTGIGLASCQKIVELHKGRMWVDSEEGNGSVFHFTIGKSMS